MLFIDISPANIPLQLPGLKVGGLSTDYFDKINTIYETELDPDDYQITQVFVNSDNYPALELIPLQINANNDILSFVSRKANTGGDTTSTLIDNPLASKMFDFLRVGPVWVLGLEECSFLANLPLNTPRNMFAIGDSIPDALVTMLNGVVGQPNWSNNPGATYSVAGFSVEYYGDVSTAPSDYFYPDKASTVIILNILQGGYLGKLMVCCR